MKSLRIDVLTNDGSPLGTSWSDIYGYGSSGRVGLGGAELALHTLCEAWDKAGHSVRLYNNPLSQGSPYPQYPIDTFIPHEERDILIVFRSPNHRVRHAKGKKIWWSCDQYTIGDFAQFSKQVDKIVTISPFHAQHFKDAYGIENTITIDLPVRIEDYGLDEDAQESKVPGRMIFCSVPDRGLAVLAQAYPRIKQEVPEASLVITSDYRLWGLPDARNEQFIRRFMGMDGVKFLGAISRKSMVHEQKKAQVQAYPCTYDELFCYAVAECQVAGAYPVTPPKGSLSTTNMGLIVHGDANNPHWVKTYADAVIHTLRYEGIESLQAEVQKKAIERFSLDRIMKEWDNVFYE